MSTVHDSTLTIKDKINEFMVFLKQPNPDSCLNNTAGSYIIIKGNFILKVNNNIIKKHFAFTEEFSLNNEKKSLKYS